MTHLEILKAAREKLICQIAAYPCQRNYICLAILAVTVKEDCNKAEDLRKWIDEMLGGRLSLNAWLIDNGFKYCTIEQANAHRILWIDKLISEYENE